MLGSLCSITNSKRALINGQQRHKSRLIELDINLTLGLKKVNRRLPSMKHLTSKYRGLASKTEVSLEMN
jgi:hypothetical protein